MTAFAVTIICGVVSDRCPGMAGPYLKEWEAVLLSFSTDHAESEVSRAHDVTSAMSMLDRRTFIHTTDGYIGISTESTQPGG